MTSLRQFPKFLRNHALASICCVITIGLVVAFLIRMDLLEQTRAEAEQLQKEAANMKVNLRNATGLKENLSAINGLLATVDARLVHQEDLASNLQYFYRLETETGAKILLLRQMTGAGGTGPVSTPAKASSRSIPYSLIIEGSFPQVMAFLTQLERGPHFNRTTVFTAQRGATDSAEGFRSGTVVVNLSIELMGTP